MKVSYKAYPVLKMLEEEKLGVIGFYQEDAEIGSTKQIMQPMKENFYKYSRNFKLKIDYLSTPFKDAIGAAMGSMLKDEVWNRQGEEFGTILNMRIPLLADNVSAMYYIRGGEGFQSDLSIVYYFIGKVFFGFRMNVPQKDYSFALFSNSLQSHFKKVLATGNVSTEGLSADLIVSELDDYVYSCLIANLNFIKYARVEVQELKAGEKIKGINCKNINESHSNVRILNSTWFTTLIKSDAFKVRGHFRLQPKKKEGEWTKELIWINEFQKEGYTAPARKLKETV